MISLVDKFKGFSDNESEERISCSQNTKVSSHLSFVHKQLNTCCSVQYQQTHSWSWSTTTVHFKLAICFRCFEWFSWNNICLWLNPAENMVLAFIISDLNGQILFSSVFDFNQSSLEKPLLCNIVRNVRSEFDFNYSSLDTTYTDDVSNLFPDFETKGIFNVKINNSYRPVIYQYYWGCLYILLCDFSDNRLLGYRTLTVIIQALRDIIPKTTNYTSQFIFHEEAVSMVVNSFIPSGQMLFLNDQAVQQKFKNIQKQLR